jgi:hypothetical protein
LDAKAGDFDAGLLAKYRFSLWEWDHTGNLLTKRKSLVKKVSPYREGQMTARKGGTEPNLIQPGQLRKTSSSFSDAATIQPEGGD